MRQYRFGSWHDGPLEATEVPALLREARSRQEALSHLSVRQIARILDRVGRRWADPGEARRRRVLAEVPAMVGFSAPMVALELEGLCQALSAEYTLAKVARELGSVAALDAWPDEGPLVRAYPRGVVLHVASGNVVTAGVLSVVEGMLTKNANLLKVASRNPLFPILFVESLQEVDEQGILAESLAVLGWPGAGSNLHREFQQACDAIVVWGGEDAVRQYREGAGIGTHVVAYGPKISFAALCQEALRSDETRVGLAEAVARDVALWDQQACSSPQVLYLETDDPASPEVTAFLDALTVALDRMAECLPIGELSVADRAEITKEREKAKIAQLLREGELRCSRRDGRLDQRWTLIREADPAFRLSPLNRTLLIKTVSQLEDLDPHLAPYRPYLQTAGLAGRPDRILALTDRWARLGVLRVVPLGQAQDGEPGEPHDGGYGLVQMIRWVSTALPTGSGPAVAAPSEATALLLPRLQDLVQIAREGSPFYRDRLATPGEPFPRTLGDWALIPPLCREDVSANTPPEGQGLLTRAPAGAYFLRSGGSSGVPKLSIVSFDEYEADMRCAARGAEAAGLAPGDRVANLFKAGDLYGSFLSSCRLLELVGCNSFPIGADLPPDRLATLISQFGLQVLMGLPSVILPVLEAIVSDGLSVPIQRIVYAGEHFYPAQRAWIRERFGDVQIGSIAYGSNDAGIMGFQCDRQTGSEHHVHAGHQYMEIVDPITFRPVPPGEAGEVLVTPLTRTLVPLLRYRIGDLARWVEGPCPCGRTAPRFELLGRADDRLVVGSLLVAYDEFLHVIQAHPECLSLPQLVVNSGPRGDRLVVRLECQSPDEALREVLFAYLREGIHGLDGALATGALEELVVELHPAGELARGRSGKIRRIVDERELGGARR